jgi:hypothetical protein
MDLTNDLEKGLAQLPPALWALSVGGEPILRAAAAAAPPVAVHESVHAFGLRVAEAVPEHVFHDADAAGLEDADPLHALASWLAAFKPSLASAAHFEGMEDGSPSPPHVGGAVARELLLEGSKIVATVGLRRDLTSVKAMLKDPDWNVPGGWREKALLELNIVINEKGAFTPCTLTTSPRAASTRTGSSSSPSVRGPAAYSAESPSQHTANHLTLYVLECILRWAYYLVRTKHLRPVFRPPRLVDGFPCFTANSDSSSINCSAGNGGEVVGVPGVQPVAAASMGGYTVFFEGSGVAMAECFSPRKLADSSAGSELIMATWAGKAVIALRMLQRELRMGPAGATPLELDATAVLNGAVMETVTRKQRFNAARIGMLRQWALDKALRLEKVGTGDMRSDILTKPVVPVKQFQRLARLLLTGDAEEPRGGDSALSDVN